MARIRTTLTAGALTLAVLAGCSSSGDGKKQASPSTSVPGSTVAGGPTTTGRPVDTSFTGKDSAQFCALAKTYTDRSTKVDPASTPAQLRSVTQEGRTAIDQAAAAAPAEIKPDVQVLANGFGTLFTELEKVNFDASKVSAAAFSPLGTPEFQASTVRFQAYIKNVCGISG
jgi:hypothetical protein